MVTGLLCAWLSCVATAADLPPELAAVIEAVAGASLPTASLELKAREGLAKGIPPTRIAAVLGAAADHLDAARSLLPDADDAVLEAAGDALGAGASPAGVQRAAAVEGTVQARALRSLADLLAIGLDEADSVRLVADASQTSDPLAHLAQLATVSAELVARGTPQGRVVDAIAVILAADRAPIGALPRGEP